MQLVLAAYREIAGWAKRSVPTDPRDCVGTARLRAPLPTLRLVAIWVLLWLSALAVSTPAAAADAAFRQWLEALWPDAQAFGISRKTFDAATAGVEPDLSLPDLDVPGRPAPQREQPEFVLRPSDYLKEATLARLSGEGRKLLTEYGATLRAIEQRFGVPPTVVLAIWGRESGFSRGYRPGNNAIRVLATQAYVGRRKDVFRQELLFALKMVEDGEVKLSEMRSSWAGAMGLTQFLPSEFYKYAVDFDGDGRRDIWNSVPDALASAAKQLAEKGWQKGQRWAYEVRVPKAVDCTLADLYVLFVGQLSDRILDARAFETPWADVVQLKTGALEEMQRRLTELGHYSEKIDGKAGMKTRLALGAYQKANGLRLDCWPTAAVIDHMRGRTRGN